MKRREFIAATAALLVSPRRSWAQGKPRRIGFLGIWADEPARDPVHAAWLSGLREDGWIAGKNLLVEYRYAPDRLPALAAELVALNPELIIASGPRVRHCRRHADGDHDGSGNPCCPEMGLQPAPGGSGEWVLPCHRTDLRCGEHDEAGPGRLVPKLRQREDEFVAWVLNSPPIRLSGAAAIFTAASTGIPLGLTHHLRHNRVLL